MTSENVTKETTDMILYTYTEREGEEMDRRGEEREEGEREREEKEGTRSLAPASRSWDSRHAPPTPDYNSLFNLQ